MATSPTAEATQRFVEALQNDFRILATESKKKFPQLKESCEEAIIVLKNATTNNQSLYYIVNQVLYPVIQGCETKDQKIIKVCELLPFFKSFVLTTPIRIRRDLTTSHICYLSSSCFFSFVSA